MLLGNLVTYTDIQLGFCSTAKYQFQTSMYILRYAAGIAEKKAAILYNRISFWLLCNIIPLYLECGILCMTGSWTEPRNRSWFKIAVRVTKWCYNPIVTTLLFSTKQISTTLTLVLSQLQKYNIGRVQNVDISYIICLLTWLGAT